MIKIPVLDAHQATSWDETARSVAGIPSRVLMESAGRAVVRVLTNEYRDCLGAGVLVVAGHGNNGGDGWVVARALNAAGVKAYGFDQDRERSTDCEANRKLALSEGVTLLDANAAWPKVGVVVDALLGTGASGKPRGFIGDSAEKIMSLGIPVVAVDGPTGLDLSTGEACGPIRADLTVTFGGARRGHLLERSWCGKVVVADIGFSEPDPEWPTLVEDRWAASELPGLDPTMHKGSRGRVLVVGGDKGMAGAALFAARTAFAAGAGLVKIAAHEVTLKAAQETLPDALTVSTALGPDLETDLLEALEWADAVVLGPGLGRGDDRTSYVASILEKTQSVVIDADALQVGLDTLSVGNSKRVLTPHPGEFRSIFHDLADLLKHDRFKAAAEAAGLASAASPAPPAPPSAKRREKREERQGTAPVVLLKGVPTVLARSGSPLRVVASGNPSLATGGSGDLLSGFIGAFLARGMDPLDAASLGAHVLGRSAEMASAKKTARATRPGDVAEASQDLWRYLADLPAPEPPVLVELESPRVV